MPENGEGEIMNSRTESVSRLAMLSCCSALVMATAAHAQSASQETSASQPAPGTDVVVTAQRRSQNIQKVPVAVTAFSRTAIERHSITNVEDLQLHVPDMNVREESLEHGLSIGIRGINVSAENFSYDSAVGVYVNSVFIARGNDFNSTFFDVDSVQVLRGPQGTLFGRDTPVGAVLIDTKRPGNTFGGYLDANLGFGGTGLGAGARRNIYRIEGAADLPIADDLKVRVAAYHIDDNGWAASRVTGYRNSSADDSGVRATAAFTPSTRFNATLIADFNQDHDGDALFVPLGFQGTPSLPLYDTLHGGTAATDALVALAKLHQPYLSFSNAPKQGINSRSYSTTLLMDYHLSDTWNLRSITGYRNLNSLSLIDQEPVPFTVFTTSVDLQQQQVSQELLLDGDVQNLHLLGGLYYFDETGFEDDLLGAADPLPGPKFLDPLQQKGGDINNSSEAVFVNASYKILPTLTVTGGIRYSEESKHLVSDSFFTVSHIPFAIGAATVRAGVPIYDAKLTWQATPGLMLYASYGTGFRSGGIGFRAPNAIFKPETSWTAEVGSKLDFDIGPMPARLNVALFDTDYKNFQVDVVGFVAGSIEQTIVNAGEATVRGAEFEFAVKPIQNLDISGSLSLLDAHYNNFFISDVTINPFGPVNFTHNQLRDAPKVSLALSGGYTVPSRIGDWVYTLDWAYQSAYETNTEFQSGAPGAARTNVFLQQPTNMVNARITLARAFGSSWDVSLWGKNLTDQARIGFTLSALGSDQATYTEPRSVGLELRTRF
jgi:iron complex outermembrane receptor protein